MGIGWPILLAFQRYSTLAYILPDMRKYENVYNL